ncbi:protein TolR [Methylothermus subterraneus]
MIQPSRPRRRPMADINVVPYIDVTLVLLIIFMVTAPLLQNGVDVDLPQAEANPVAVEPETPPVIVTVTADGSCHLDWEGAPEVVSPESLLVKVTAILRHKPKTQVLVAGDSTVAYGKVVEIMAALRQAGVSKVGLLTRPPTP